VIHPGNYSLYGVSYGSNASSSQVVGYACFEYTITPSGVYPFQNVLCKLSGGVGFGLRFTIAYCPPVLAPQCLSQSSDDLIDFPLPTLTPNTLRLPANTTSIGTNSLTVKDADSQLIAFDGTGFIINNTQAMVVTFGPSTDVHMYECTLDVARTTVTSIFCYIEANADGTDFVFAVTVPGGHVAVGTDKINFPNVPRIYKVSGCAADTEFAAVGCPTYGGITVTIAGKYFLVNNLPRHCFSFLSHRCLLPICLLHAIDTIKCICIRCEMSYN
jgi:hypothetical protein